MLNLKENTVLHGFHVDRAVYVKEIDSQAYEMHHEQSGAKVLYLKIMMIIKYFPFLSGQRRQTVRACLISASIRLFAAPVNSR